MTPSRHTLEAYKKGGTANAFTFSVNVTGMRDGYYEVGDVLEGELVLRAKRDVRVRSVTVRLDYLLASSENTRTLPAAVLPVTVGPEVIRQGETRRFPLRSSVRFGRISFKGALLKNVWQLMVDVQLNDGRPSQNLFDKFIDPRTRRDRQFVGFGVPVRYSRGAYRVAERDLRVPLLSEKAWLWGLVGFVAVALFTFVPANHDYDLELLFGGWLTVLTLTLIYQFVYLNTFQATPLEVLPRRDGALRLRLLDRGNDVFAKASVGYRVREHAVVREGGEVVQKKTTVFHQKYRFRNVARRHEQFHDILLPWPERDLPTSFKTGQTGYEWELFLSKPNPLTGVDFVVRWPLRVTRENFRLTPPTEAEKAAEAEEVLELRELSELERVTTPAGGRGGQRG